LYQEGVTRRFLAYSSPSRSPNPNHLAGLARPGFVRAAPAFPAPPESGCPQLRRPAATGSATKASHLRSNHCASRRTHDLRHTFATLRLSSGVHFMQVSKWLGHSTFTLTLDVYGDYIPEGDDGAANTLPEPPALGVTDAGTATNVVELFGRRSV
jgi:integrase